MELNRIPEPKLKILLEKIRATRQKHYINNVSTQKWWDYLRLEIKVLDEMTNKKRREDDRTQSRY